MDLEEADRTHQLQTTPLEHPPQPTTPRLQRTVPTMYRLRLRREVRTSPAPARELSTASPQPCHRGSHPAGPRMAAAPAQPSAMPQGSQLAGVIPDRPSQALAMPQGPFCDGAALPLFVVAARRGQPSALGDELDDDDELMQPRPATPTWAIASKRSGPYMEPTSPQKATRPDSSPSVAATTLEMGRPAKPTASATNDDGGTEWTVGTSDSANPARAPTEARSAQPMAVLQMMMRMMLNDRQKSMEDIQSTATSTHHRLDHYEELMTRKEEAMTG